MLRARLILAAVLLVTVAMPGWAADDPPIVAPRQTLVVNVRTGPEPSPTDVVRPEANTPVPGGGITVIPLSGGEGGMVKTDAYGTATMELAPGGYKVVVEAPGGQIGVEYINVSAVNDPPRLRFDKRSMPDREYAEDWDAATKLSKAIADAAKACDRAEYDRLVAELRRIESMDRINRHSLEQMKRRLGASAKGPSQELEQLRRRMKETEQALSDLPPFPEQCTQTAGVCPEGTTPAYLASALNSLFNTNLDTDCVPVESGGSRGGGGTRAGKHHDEHGGKDKD